MRTAAFESRDDAELVLELGWGCGRLADYVSDTMRNP